MHSSGLATDVSALHRCAMARRGEHIRARPGSFIHWPRNRGGRFAGVCSLEETERDMTQRTMRSRYMEWAKTRSQARYNLATSGITNVLMREFPPVRIDNLELTHGGYGYQPLLERIAQHNGATSDCVVTAAGTSMANHLAMAAALAPGDEVVI